MTGFTVSCPAYVGRFSSSRRSSLVERRGISRKVGRCFWYGGILRKRSLVAVVTLMALTGRVPRRPSVAVIRCGLFYAMTVTTFVVATKITTAANAIVLQYAAPS